MWSLLFVDILHWKKYPYISSDVSWRVFCILTEPVTQTSPSEFLRFTDTNVHITGYVKIRKTRHKISVDIWIFFTVWNSSLYDAPLFCCSIFQLIGMIGISSCICVDSVCYRFRALLLLHFFHFFCTECCRNQIVWYWCTSCSIADQVPIYSRWVWDSRNCCSETALCKCCQFVIMEQIYLVGVNDVRSHFVKQKIVIELWSIVSSWIPHVSAALQVYLQLVWTVFMCVALLLRTWLAIKPFYSTAYIFVNSQLLCRNYSLAISQYFNHSDIYIQENIQHINVLLTVTDWSWL